VQVRVVIDQPWDVRADVLVIPVAGSPVFEGPLDELRLLYETDDVEEAVALVVRAILQALEQLGVAAGTDLGRSVASGDLGPPR